MKISDIPVGTEVPITTGVVKCSKCGVTAENLSYTGFATDCYATRDGIKRRAFVFANRAFCGCSDRIWLPCDDEVTVEFVGHLFVEPRNFVPCTA